MFTASDEQRMLVDSVRELARNEFRTDGYGGETDIPWENVRILADNGFVGINFDEKYGGGGLSELDSLLLIETVGRISPDTAAYLAEQQMVAPRAIEMFGTESAKETYLPLVTAGEGGVAIAISEPDAGSDVANMDSTVTEDDAGTLHLNGEKIWVSRVPEYDAAVVWVKFEGEGLGSVVVDFDQPGVEVGQRFTNMAGHEQTQLYFEDVPIPEENVLVRGEQAFERQLEALNWERLSIAATMNAAMLCAMDDALEYADHRQQFDQEISEFQGMRWKFADMAKRIQASRALTYRTADTAAESDGAPDPLNANISKLFTTEVAEEVISEALQVHGANGYQRGHRLEYLYRFVRGYRIAGGTDEIHKNTIGSLLDRHGIPQVA